MSTSFLFQAVIFLTAAIICVPIAKRLGMGSVLGYLLAGIIIGPFALGFVGQEGEDIMHFAEFGVVLMLFLIGLELEPKKFLRMWKVIMGMGGVQLGLTASIIFGGCLLLGFTWKISLALALALSLSSTAIVLQTLKEKDQMGSPAGRSSFFVLLFQDIAVIPILAVLPLLATREPEAGLAEHGHTIIENMPAWIQTLAVFAAVLLIIGVGTYVVAPLLRQIAQTKLRELFAASALLIVLSIAFLMEQVGLSPALGTFLGGVVLANSEFRHELESDLEPFKGLLLGLFFITVGASINFNLIGEEPLTILSAVLAIMAIKAAVLYVVGRIYKLNISQNLIFAIGLSQVGEFAFVLISFMDQLNLLGEELSDLVMGITALSMTLTPLLILFNEQVVLPRLCKRDAGNVAMDTVDEENDVILVGFGHFGSTIGRFLRANGVEATVLDYDANRVDLLRKMGFKVYYGDASRLDMLESAGIEKAKILIIAIDSPTTNEQLVRLMKKHYPHVELFVRAKSRVDAYGLIDEGLERIYRESLDTSVRVGVDVLTQLGKRSYSIHRAAQKFVKHDEISMRKLASKRHNSKEYVSESREAIKSQEDQLKRDYVFKSSDADHAWDSEQMREAQYTAEE